MPVIEFLGRWARWLDAFTQPLVEKTRDIGAAWPLKAGEVGLYAIYTAEHAGKPAKDYHSAELWYQKSFLLMLLLGGLMLQALLAR